MATSLMQKQRTGTWSAIFPTEQVTQQQSALFVKKLLAVAISNITYLRTIFPEHAFGDRCLEDLSLKILRDDSACPGACQVIQWVKGCFDALDRNYLRMIIVGIYVDANNPMTAVETYTFKFDYITQEGITIFRNDTKVASAYTEIETKRATIQLLRTIIVLTQTLQPLPDDVMMTMKLYYYDDVTPEDYEPPGFHSTTCDDFNFDDDPYTIKIGDVKTPFHCVKLRIKTKSAQFASVEGCDLTDKDRNIGEESCNGGVVSDKMDYEEEKDAKLADIANGNAHEPTGHEQSHVAMVTPPEVTTVHTSEDNIVRCPCGVNEDDGLMVLCGICQVWQHSICFSLLEMDLVPDLHICVKCSKGSQHQCTDPSLSNLSHAHLQSTCIWRRSIHACCDLTRLLPAGLSRRLGVDLSVAHGLMERLEKEGYVRPPTKGRKWGRLVAKDKVINEGIPKYFPLSKVTLTSKNEPHPPPVMGVESLSHKANVSMAPVHQIRRSQTNKDTNGVQSSPKTRAKRVRSVVDESKEFELSCSQDQEACQDQGACQDQEGACQDAESGRKKKRRKASIASSSIMV